MTDIERPVTGRAPEQVVDDRAGAAETQPRGRPGPYQLAAVAVGVVVLVLVGARLPTTTVLTLENVLALALFAVATNLLIGYGGLVSFGQAAFLGIGSYVVALNWLHWHWSFWVGFALAPVVAAAAALVVGALALRTRRLYFALLTLAFSQLFTTIAQKWYGVTQGDNGIFGAITPASLADPRNAYMFVLAVVGVSLLVLWKVTVSPFGLSLRAVRENRERAAALGLDVYRHQLLAFVISGFFCGLAGALLVVHDQAAYPQLLDWTRSGDAVLMVVIGGMYQFLGPAIGAFVYQFGHDFIVQYTKDWQLVLGLVLLAVVLFAPDGLAGLLDVRTWRSRFRRSSPAGDADLGEQR